jgi:hypothetical protein
LSVLNYRLAKVHHTYTVNEVAALYGIHRNTVCNWFKLGLRRCDDRRPTLIRGADLGEFLRKRREARRRPCPPGHLYCVRCRTPRFPAEGMADYEPTSPTLGNIVGLCPTCGGVMCRRVNPAQLDEVRGGLEVRIRRGLRDVAENSNLSANCAFNEGTTDV